MKSVQESSKKNTKTIMLVFAILIIPITLVLVIEHIGAWELIDSIIYVNVRLYAVVFIVTRIVFVAVWTLSYRLIEIGGVKTGFLKRWIAPESQTLHPFAILFMFAYFGGIISELYIRIFTLSSFPYF